MKLVHYEKLFYSIIIPANYPTKYLECIWYVSSTGMQEKYLILFWTCQLHACESQCCCSHAITSTAITNELSNGLLGSDNQLLVQRVWKSWLNQNQSLLLYIQPKSIVVNINKISLLQKLDTNLISSVNYLLQLE